MDGPKDTIFYKIANGKVDSHTVYENDEFRCVLDTNPGADGHVVILPKQPISITPQMTGEMNLALADAIKKVSQAALQSLQCEGTTMFIANGPGAGQRVPYALIHLIPRREGDGIRLQPERKKISEEKHLAMRKQIQQALGVSGEAPEPDSDDDIDFDAVQRYFT